MTKEELLEVLALIEKAEKEHPNAYSIESTGMGVRVTYMYYPEIDPLEPF